MDPKKMLSTPEKTAAAEAEKAAGEEAIRQHYEHAERVLEEIKNNPSAEGGFFQLVKELLAKFPDLMSIRLTDEPRTEKEKSSIRERSGAFTEFFETRFRQIMSAEDSDVRKGIAANVRRLMPSKYKGLTESTLQSLNVTDAAGKDTPEEPSNTDTEKEKA